MYKRHTTQRELTRTPMGIGVTCRRQGGFTPYHFFKKSDTGFTLLFSALVAALLLALGLSIFNISIKELMLSTTARDSQFAFYAADSARECALYWEFRRNVFDPDDPDTEFTCNGNTYQIGGKSYSGAGEYTYEMSASPTPDNAIQDGSLSPERYCADIRVTKYEITNPQMTDPPDSFTFFTHIVSNGYNNCEAASERRVQRTIEDRF